ncbi:MAG TPA: polysaccharide deacetylase family protein [Novimethylophilus sp.]|uniref:polysaccharide deacetylase family protein n=1 Tax=Novimethylophilus sp. TaxID=2137426 RepID=UPI002F3E7FA1
MRSIPILMYHNIGRPLPGDRKPKLYVRADIFSRQMALLRLLGFRGISMSEAMPYLRGELQGKVVVITFDDGYADTVDLALPTLRRYGHTATCYVVSQRIGQHNTWDADQIGAHKPLMSKEQLLYWSAAGMGVGAHTQTHPHLPDCDDVSLLNEVAGSKAELEALLQTPVAQFCYPYGALDRRVVEAVRAAGYDAATTTGRGLAVVGGDLHTLPRERPRVSRILYKLGLGLG